MDSAKMIDGELGRPAPTSISLADSGAVGDGESDCTSAIQGAIDRIAAAGGGRVTIPAGRWLTGALRLGSGVELFVGAGAVLLFSGNPEHHPTVQTRWEGKERRAYAPCIFGEDCENVSLRGCGTIDGRGPIWWDECRRQRAGKRSTTDREREFDFTRPQLNEEDPVDGRFLRPPLVQFKNCRNVRLEGLSLRNSPFWSCHILYCSNVVVTGISVFNPSDSPNTDGLDIDSSRDVRVSDCTFDVGDDCVCLKSGADADGRFVNVPTENISVSNCTMLHGHGGVVVGSETAGGIRGVTVSGCVFDGTERGVRVKGNRLRGGLVEAVRVSTVVMRHVWVPLLINANYSCGIPESRKDLLSSAPHPVTEATPRFRDIHISDVSAVDATAAAAIVIGLCEAPVRNISVRDMSVTFSADRRTAPTLGCIHPQRRYVAEGLTLSHIVDSRFTDISLAGVRGPAVTCRDSRRTRIEGWADGERLGAG